MGKFLFESAERLLSKHKGKMEDVIVVLPARRSILFLQKYFAEIVQEAMWLPQMQVFPQFLEWLSSRSVISGHEVLIDLYKCHQNAIHDKLEFEVFCQWASTAIRDFDDVDSSLSNSSMVFTNLKNIREIDGWSFNSEILSDSQKQFIAFWDNLGKLYQEYSTFQKEHQRWSYNGLIRWVNSEIQEIESRIQGKSLYFIGMASFSTGEMELIKKLSSVAEVNIWWDLDEYYTNDSVHEAGYFARIFKKNFSTIEGVKNELSHNAKDIFIYETTTAIGQCYGAADRLSKMSVDELSNTCVVIVDERLAEPFLESLSLPDVAVNLAIGLPLGSTAAARWIDSMLRIKRQLYINSRGIYHKDFSEWLQFCVVAGLKENEILSLQQKIITDLKTYISQDYLSSYDKGSELLRELISLLFDEDVIHFVNQCRSLLYSSTMQEIEPNDIQKISSLKVVQILEELSDSVRRNDFLQHIGALKVLWNQMLIYQKLQYEGEPVSGLQVLGLRETRSLDFEHLFILGANEEHLPGNKHHQSFIPNELRGYFKLPLSTEQENMTAYMFYRLLQYPKDIHIFYSTISSDFKGTEQSRYITQIESELVSVNQNITLSQHKMTLKEPEIDSSIQSVPSSDFIKSRLDSILSYGISPSAINTFNSCPLDFYYKYILGLGEEVKMEEQISPATFGSIVHEVLERFYNNFINSYPEEKDYDALISAIDEKLDTAFNHIYSTENIAYGNNYLARVVAKKMLVDFIRYEKKTLAERKSEGFIPKVLQIEQMLKREVPMEKYGIDKPIALRGKVDRIDEIKGKIHILDYKTGKVEEKDVNLKKEIEEVWTSDNQGKLLQLLSYIYMYCADGKSSENVTAGFYSFTKHQQGFLMLNSPITDEMHEQIEKSFVAWTQQLYEMESFDHNPKAKYCSYCSGINKVY